MKKVLQMLAYDQPGVLDRIVGLIRRRNWNIDSLTAGEIGDGLTQITFLLEGRDMDIASLGEHLEDMDAVRVWHTLEEGSHTLRELLLFGVPSDRRALAERPGVRILSEQDRMLLCEYTDMPSGVDAFAKTLRAEGLPCTRSGPLSPPVPQEKEKAHD